MYAGLFLYRPFFLTYCGNDILWIYAYFHVSVNMYAYVQFYEWYTCLYMYIRHVLMYFVNMSAFANGCICFYICKEGRCLRWHAPASLSLFAYSAYLYIRVYAPPADPYPHIYPYIYLSIYLFFYLSIHIYATSTLHVYHVESWRGRLVEGGSLLYRWQTRAAMCGLPSGCVTILCRDLSHTLHDRGGVESAAWECICFSRQSGISNRQAVWGRHLGTRTCC